MQDLLEAPVVEQARCDIFAGYRGPADPEPQQYLPGFFDAEISALHKRVSDVGSELVSFTLRAPAGIFGWFFETERPWWPDSKS